MTKRVLTKSRLWRIGGYTVYFCGRHAYYPWFRVWKWGKRRKPGMKRSRYVGPFTIWRTRGNHEPWNAR